MKKFTYLLMFFSLYIQPGWTRTNPDSLRQVIKKSAGDEGELHALLELADYLRMRKNDSTLILGTQAEKLAYQLGDWEAALKAASVQGLYQHNQGNRQEAKRIFIAALQKARKEAINNMIPVIQNNLAMVYRRDEQQDSAFYYWSLAEKGYEAAGFPYEVWRVYLGMSQLFLERGDLISGEEYLKKAYDIASSGNNAMDQGYLLFQLADFYFSNENFDRLAEIQIIWDNRQALRRTSKELMELPEHTSMLFLFGQTKPDIIPRLERAAAYFQEKGDSYNEAWVLENLGLYLSRNGQGRKGKDILERALKLFTEHNSKIRLGAVRYELYQAYKNLGESDNALKVLEEYNYLKDSLRSEEIQENLSELQVRYETEKKEQLLLIQDLELKQKTQQRNALLAVTLFLTLLAFSISLGYRQRLRTNRKLSEQAAEIQAQKIRQLEQDNQLLSMNAMIEGQESERMRIAQDLHDGIGGLLTTVKAHFYSIQEQVEKLQKHNIYQKTNELIDEACIEVRRISQNMMPRALQILGLNGAIEDLATQLRQGGLECNLEIIGLDDGLENTRSAMLFRIVQELCNNISKHAAAQKVFIQLLRQGTGLSLIVEDDGKGFDYKTTTGKKPSLGLKNIESRVRFLKGEWDIDTVPGEGTTIMIRVPLL